jgi:hypothetical protein
MGSFSNSVRKFAETTKYKTEAVIKQTSYEVFRRILYRTPVLTGAARGNWSASVGTYVAPIPDLARIDPEGANTLEEIARTVNSFKLVQKNLYFANNLPYIIYLENGHSQLQAPNGMVVLTMQEFGQIFDTVVQELRR